MAWTCNGRTNEEMIDRLKEEGLITSDRVAKAMKNVNRANYVPVITTAYEDSPQTIGFGATISAPHMHAHACENLLPFLDQANEEGGAVLDVGSGSGYLTAVLHFLAPHASVIGIDHISGLTDQSKQNLRKDGVELGEGKGRVNIVTGDGRKGCPQYGPFQVIHVGAAAPEIPPDLVEQLAKPGRMFIPVGTTRQDIWQVDKLVSGEISKKKLFGVRYVPLTDAARQWRE